METLLTYTILFLSIFSYAQKPAYQIFDAKGKKVKYKKVVKSLLGTEVVLFGEIHNNPISHWLTLELAKSLKEKQPLQIGMEMFERHQVELLERYSQNKISEKDFVNDETQWSNFETDYFPLVKWAKQNEVAVIATNITRKYASQVFRKGMESLDTLSIEVKQQIAPLPMPFDGNLPQYQKMLSMMGGHGGENLVKAQAIKDATMAHFLLKSKDEDTLFLHVNGSYHSDFYEGIGWYLKQYNEAIEFKTISTVEQEDISSLEKENIGKADYIICVPESMTKTY